MQNPAVSRDRLVLWSFTLFAIGSIGVFVVFSEPLGLLPLGVLLLVSALRRWKDLVFLLPFLSAMAGWTIEVGGLGIRLDQALSVFLTVILVISAINGRLRLRTTGVAVGLSFVVISNIVSSLFSQDPRSSMVQVVNIASSISIYFVLLNLLRSRETYEKFVSGMIAAAFAAMAYGLILLILAVSGVDVGGVNIQENVAGFGIYGSMREQNIFGSYSAGMLLIGVTMYFADLRGRLSNRRFVALFILTAAFALLFSFARGAWVGAIVGFLALSFHRRRGLDIFSPKLVSLALLLIVIVILLFSYGIVPSSLYSYKVENLFNFEEGTGLYRAKIWVKAWANFLEHPLLGNGTYSYSYLNREDTLFEGPGGLAWISNIFLLALHDTGLVGMFLFLIFLWLVFRESRMSIRSALDERLRNHAIAFQVAFIVLLVAFQATSAFYYGYTWIIIGLIAVTKTLIMEDREIRINPLA